MKMPCLLFAAIPLLAMVPPSVDKPFRRLDCEAALRAAQAEQKVVMIDFFTTWCGPCKKLDQVTWKDAGVQAWLAEKTVALKIDAEKESGLAKKYAVRAYPSLVFLASDGKELGRIVGYRDPKQFLKEAPDALAGIKPSERITKELESGEKDPSKRQRLADALVREKRYAEALEHYLWCFDHGLEHGVGYGGVRLSFLPSAIARLGEVYPPALEALRERRDAAKKALLDGEGTVNEAAELAAICRYLDEPGLVLEVYDALKESEGDDPKRAALRARLFDEVLDPLLEARRYADVVAGADPAKMLAQRIQRFEATEQQFRDHDHSPADFMRRKAIALGGQLYEALIGTQEHDRQAANLQQLLLDFAPEPETWTLMIEHARRAERADVVTMLEKQAADSVPPKKRTAGD